MNLTANCAWAAVRATGIGACSVLAGLAIRALIVNSPRRGRALAWSLLLTPYLAPSILVGYAYSSFALSLVRHPTCNRALYVLLVWVRLAPVATVVLYFAPTPISGEGLHCHRLLRKGAVSALAFWLRGPGQACAVAFAVVFLFAFGEFELASLLGVRSWTVSLFDAHAGGLALSESSRLALAPALCEGLLLLAAMVIVLRGRPAVRGRRGVRVGRWLRWAVWLYIGAAAVVGGLVPAFVVLRGTMGGLSQLAQSLKLAGDVAASVLFAAAAAACAWLAAGMFSIRRIGPAGTRRRVLWAFCLSVPGLLGPLVLSLLVLSVFQQPGFHAVYDTPLPLLCALVLVLFPFALLLRLLMEVIRPEPGLHAAQLLRASNSPVTRRCAGDVLWHLKTRGQFWVVFLLFCWGYFDLTASHILHPSAMTPVFVWLYNFMHYGQSAVLSAMVCVAIAIPILLLLAVGVGRRVYSRVYAHG